MKQELNNLPYLKPIRKRLRNNLTSAEATLWNALKNGQLGGRKFRRQHSISNYVLDFYCPSEKINVELDGAHHFTDNGEEKDRKRDAFLKKIEINILRVENKEVFENLEGVLELIRSNFKK